MNIKLLHTGLVTGFIALTLNGCASSSPLASKSSMRPPVEVELRVYAGDMDKVAQNSGTLPLTFSKLISLWKHGHVQLIGYASVTTQLGFEAEASGVKEIIYAENSQGEQHASQEPDETNSDICSGSPPDMKPSDFFTREVGLKFHVLPEVNSNGNIQLTLSPDMVGLPMWLDPVHPKGTNWVTTGSLPVFSDSSINTCIRIADGQTIIIGKCTDPVDKNRVRIFTVTLRINHK